MMAVVDPDKHLETMTHDEVYDLLRKGVHGSTVGLHIGSVDENYLHFLEKELLPGEEFPLQICSGPLLTLRYTSRLPEYLVAMVREKKIRLVVHLPFVLTFYKNYNELGYQRQYFQELGAYYNSLNIPVEFVAHCGHPALKDLDVEKAERTFLANVTSAAQYLASDRCFLNIENLASVPEWCSIHRLLKYFGKGLPVNVGLCLDTEHAFGAGDILADITDEELSRVRVVHLNSAPSNVKLGSGIDLHSYTIIEDTIRGGYGVFSVGGNDLSVFLSRVRGLPKILERHLMSIMAKDICYCRGI